MLAAHQPVAGPSNSQRRNTANNYGSELDSDGPEDSDNEEEVLPVKDDNPMHPRNGNGGPHIFYSGMDQDDMPKYVTVDQLRNELGSLKQNIVQGFQTLGGMLLAGQPQNPLPAVQHNNRPRGRKARQYGVCNPPKLYNLPGCRTEEVKELHCTICEHFNRLLGPNPLHVTVTQDESTAYATQWLPDEGLTCGPSTGVQPFQIDIAGLP